MVWGYHIENRALEIRWEGQGSPREEGKLEINWVGVGFADRRLHEGGKLGLRTMPKSDVMKINSCIVFFYAYRR